MTIALSLLIICAAVALLTQTRRPGYWVSNVSRIIFYVGAYGAIINSIIVLVRIYLQTP